MSGRGHAAAASQVAPIYISPCGQGMINIDDLVHGDLSDMTTADFEEVQCLYVYIRINRSNLS